MQFQLHSQNWDQAGANFGLVYNNSNCTHRVGTRTHLAVSPWCTKRLYPFWRTWRSMKFGPAMPATTSPASPGRTLGVRFNLRLRVFSKKVFSNKVAVALPNKSFPTKYFAFIFCVWSPKQVLPEWKRTSRGGAPGTW
jgi:hypothetical protein